MNNYQNMTTGAVGDFLLEYYYLWKKIVMQSAENEKSVRVDVTSSYTSLKSMFFKISNNVDS